MLRNAIEIARDDGTGLEKWSRNVGVNLRGLAFHSLFF